MLPRGAVTPGFFAGDGKALVFTRVQPAAGGGEEMVVAVVPLT